MGEAARGSPDHRRGTGPARRLARAALLAALLAWAPRLDAQRRVTLEEAIAAAERSAPSLAAARADSAAARAEVALARAFPAPLLSLDYSRSAPRHHLELEQPLEYPWVRRPRIRAAETAVGAARLLTATERAAVRYRVEVAYAQAAGAAEVRALSREDVAGGEALVRSVRERRREGDVSDLDVELAEVTLGQLRGAALTDSLAAVQAVLALQSLMGLPTDRALVEPADSLAAIPAAPAAPAEASAPALRVVAAEQRLAAEQARLRAARRGRLPAPSLRAGVEEGDPSGDEPGVLPTVGVSIPLPLWSRGGAVVEQARAALARAQAELDAARRETELARAAAERERSGVLARLEVDRETALHARRVADLSLTAYREGAYPIASVLQARRDARDALRRYLEDLIARRTAEAALRLATVAGGPLP